MPDNTFETMIDPGTGDFLGLIDPVTGERVQGTEEECIRSLPDRLLPPWLRARKSSGKAHE